MGFQDIVGQEGAVRILQDQLKSGRINHAYLFTGKEGVGKKQLAFQFAKALNCPEEGEDSCDQCLSCRRINHSNHPDVSLLELQDGKFIGIEQVREMQKEIAYKPYQSDWKIYIIDGADKMTPEAANSLLKTLEEPPHYAILILLAWELDKLLPTIISRCQQVPLNSLSRKVIRSEIKRRFPENENTDLLSRLADGSLGRAINLAGNEDFFNLREEIINFLDKLPDTNVVDLFRQVDTMVKLLEKGGENENEKFPLFDLLLSWYRDIIMYNQQMQDEMVNFDCLERIKSQIGIYTIEELISIIEMINVFKGYLARNVRADLVLQVMFLKIRSKRMCNIYAYSSGN